MITTANLIQLGWVAIGLMAAGAIPAAAITYFVMKRKIKKLQEA